MTSRPVGQEGHCFLVVARDTSFCSQTFSRLVLSRKVGMDTTLVGNRNHI